MSFCNPFAVAGKGVAQPSQAATPASGAWPSGAAAPPPPAFVVAPSAAMRVNGPVDYRPQWVPASRKGCREQTFIYFYDLRFLGSPAGASQVAAVVNATRENITLALQIGSEFAWRGVRVSENDTHGTDDSLFIQFRDPNGYALSSDYVCLNEYVHPSGSYAGGLVTPVEPEIVCPSGSAIIVSFQCISNVGPYLPAVTLYGVKRYDDGGGM